jgi:mannose-6-phosphate isomerase-like protein (cupin superfamily)
MDENIVIKKWGHYKDHYRTDEMVCKTLYIEPDKAISYQYHKGRSEFWYIQSGKGELTIDDYTYFVSEGFDIIIRVDTKHKIKNVGETMLIIHEMQYGYLCSELDIVRLDE